MLAPSPQSTTIFFSGSILRHFDMQEQHFVLRLSKSIHVYSLHSIIWFENLQFHSSHYRSLKVHVRKENLFSCILWHCKNIPWIHLMNLTPFPVLCTKYIQIYRIGKIFTSKIQFSIFVHNINEVDFKYFMVRANIL